MKALFLFVFAFASAAVAVAQDPFQVALQHLPEQHEHSSAQTTPLSLAELEQIALQSNLEIRLAVRRVSTAEARIPGAGALEDATVSYRGWQVPLRQPWNYNAALNMFMVGQSLPGPGKRALRSEVASDAVSVAKQDLEGKKREVLARMRKAYYDLLRNADELRVHDEQVAIARQALEAARIKYSNGKVPQQDVLKAQVALTKLAEHLVLLEEDGELARAALNTLLGREPDAPLQVSGEYGIPTQLPNSTELERLALTSRPELAAITAAIKQSEDETRLAQKSYTPDFNVSAGYMLMPNTATTRNTYMVEGSMSLPWLNRRKHASEISEAESRVAERRAEFDVTRAAVFQQIREAWVRASAARRLVELYRASLRPQSEATLRSTVIAYENDRTDILNLLDSQNTTLDVDVSYFRALADFEARMAELELAVGAPIPRTKSGTEVVR
jgi:outer membrane protein, heavy metal efflux system